MNELFDSLRKFLDAIEQGAKDAGRRGTAWLRHAADWLDGVIDGVSLSEGPGISDEEFSALEARLQAIATQPETVGWSDQNAKKIDPATIALILQLVILVIEAIKKRRENKPPLPPPA